MNFFIFGKVKNQKKIIQTVMDSNPTAVETKSNTCTVIEDGPMAIAVSKNQFIGKVSSTGMIQGLSTGNYLFKEKVTGKSTGTTAEVANWDRDDRILKVTNVAGSGFAVGEAVVGIGTTQNGSDSEYIVFSRSDDDEYDPYGENSVVESEADAIIDFSEDNPFGDF